MLSREAQVVDVLRSIQRDDLAIRAIEDNMQAFCKSFSIKTYRTYSKFIPCISSFWYYYVTSGSNLQTLGEEYSSILRLSDENMIPSRLTQLIWLALYIGGEPLLNRLIQYIEVQIRSSGELSVEARELLYKMLSIWHSHKETLKTIHRALFYINGKYYSVAHRIAGIKYVLLRDWLEDKTFVRSFRILGNISLLYCLFDIGNKLWNSRLKNIEDREDLPVNLKCDNSIKICILCNEQRKAPSVTPCGHIFCWDCVHESLSYQRKCPLCREEVDPSRIILLQNYI